MSNFVGPLGSEMSVLCHWFDGEAHTLRGLQLLKDGRIAKVDKDLNVLETYTVEEAKAVKASVPWRIVENHEATAHAETWWRGIREGKP